MTDIWRLVFPLIILSLVILCDDLIRIGENHRLLRLTWRCSESTSEYESVRRICVWIIIHKYLLLENACFNNKRQKQNPNDLIYFTTLVLDTSNTNDRSATRVWNFAFDNNAKKKCFFILKIIYFTYFLLHEKVNP